MQLPTTLAVAYLAHTALAGSYQIKLWPKNNCKDHTIRHAAVYICNLVAATECCSNSGLTYHSASFTENGGDDCSDQIKLYQTYNDEPCGLNIAAGSAGTCVDAPGKITGAAVHVVLDFKKRDGGEGSSAAPMTMRRPDQFAAYNGSLSHVIDIDSERGRELQLLAREEDRINYALRWGRPEPVVQRRSAGCQARKGGKGGRNNGKTTAVNTNTGKGGKNNGKKPVVNKVNGGKTKGKPVVKTANRKATSGKTAGGKATGGRAKGKKAAGKKRV